MANSNEIKATIMLDGEQQFKQAVANATAGLKTLGTESKLVEEKFRGQANSLEALQAKHSVLSRTLDEQKNKQKAIADALSNAQKNYDKVGNGLTELRSKLDSATDKLEEMKKTASSDEIAQQEKEVKQLSDAVKLGEQNYQRAGKSIQNWTQAQNRAEAETIRLERELNQTDKYIDEARNSSDHCATSIDNMGREARTAASGMEEVGDAASEAAEDMEDAGESSSMFGELFSANVLGDLASKGLEMLGDAAKDAAKYVIDVGSSFEAAMSEVQAISGATGSDLTAISDKAKELGASTKFSATEAAEAFKYMSLAGWDTAQMLDGIDGVMDLAAASGMELAEASDMVTDYLSAFGMAASESTKIADMLAYAQAHSNTTAEQLGEAYGNCAANMHAAGQDIETTTSVLEAFANQGVKGSEAGTKLSAIMRDITAKMKDGKIAIGDTSVEVMDTNGNFRDLTDILADVEEATAGMGDAQKAAALSATFTSRSVGGLNMILTEGAGNIENYETSLRNADGAAQDTATTMQDNLAGDITTFNSTVEGLGITLYGYVNGPVRGMVQGATKVIQGLTEVLTPQKDAFQEMVDNAKDANTELSTAIENADNIMENADNEAARYEALGEQLISLNGIEDKTLAQKYQMSAVVAELGKQIPEIAEAYDEEAGKVDLTDENIRNLITSTKDLMIAQAAQSAMQGVVNELMNAEVELNNAKTAKSMAEDRLKLLQEEKDTISELYSQYEGGEIDAGVFNTKQIDFWKKALDEGRISLDEYNEACNLAGVHLYGQAMEKNSAETQEWTGKNEEATTSVANLTTNVENGKKKLDGYGEAMGDLRDSLDGLTDSSSGAADGQQGLGQSIEESQKIAQEAIVTTEAAADAQKSAMQDVLDTYHGYVDEIKTDLQDKISLFDKFDGGTDMTVEEMSANLDSQLAGIQKYKEDMKYVMDTMGDDLDAGFVQLLQSMGLNAANVWSHFRTTLEQQGSEIGTEGYELVKGLGEKWGDGMDYTEDIAKAQAANKIAYEAGLKELGSTDVEFDGLEEAINQGINGAIESWDNFSGKTKIALGKVVDEAREMGIQIPQGLTDGILDGSIGPDEALGQISGAMQGRLDGLAQVAQEAGVQLTDEIKAGLESSDPAEIVSAWNAIIEQLSTNVDISQAEQTGQEMGEGVNSGIESTADGATTAGETLADNAAEGANKTDGATASGTAFGGAFSTALAQTTGTANAAGMALGQAAYEGLTTYTASFQTVGYNMAVGVATGIANGQSGAITAAVNLATAALQAAKDALHIQSPSRKFRKEVGEMIGEGMAQGIDAKKGAVKKATEALASQTLKSATKWLKRYKQANDVSLDEEEYYWQQMLKKLTKGTTAYETASKKLWNVRLKQSGLDAGDWKNTEKKISDKFGVSKTKTSGSGKNQKTTDKDASAYYSEIFSAAQKYFNNQQVLSDWSLEVQLQYWKEVKKQLKKGTDAWYNAQKEINQVNDKIKDEKASTDADLVAEGEEYVRRQQILGKMSTAEELAYWEETIKLVKKKGPEWYDIKEKIKGLKEDVNEEAISDGEEFVRRQKILGKMSTQQELQYWKDMLAKTKEGSDQWFELKEKVNDLEEEAANEKAQANDRIVSDAETYLDHQKILNDVSLDYELAYWEEVLKLVDEGSDAWWDAMAKVKDIKEQMANQAEESAQDALASAEDIAKRTASVQSSILSKYKTYYDVSAKAEMQYWDIARQKFQEGTDERIEADQNYFDARDDYYDRMAELDEEYAEKKQDIDDDLAKSIEDLQKSYEDAVASREQEIKSSMNLFEDWDAEGWDPDTLLTNISHQVEGLQFWRKQLADLSKKGLSQGLMKELEDMGPDAAANLWSLNQMTADQLDEFQQMWQEKSDLAHAQAVEDNKDLYSETQQQIADARKNAAKALQDIQADYRKNVAELNEELSEGLKSLVEKSGEIGEDMVSKLIQAVRDGVKDVGTEIAKLNAEAEKAKQEADAEAARLKAQEDAKKATEGAQQAKADLTAGSNTGAGENTGAGAGGNPTGNQGGNTGGGQEPEKVDKILAIINTGNPHAKKINKDEQNHSELWKHIVKTHGHIPTFKIYKKLADELGVTADAKATEAQKNKILKALKKKGYRTGTRNILEDGLANWLENNQTEYLVRKTDGAIIQPVRRGDAIINPEGGKVLYDLANNPDEFLAQRLRKLSSYAGIERLNRLTDSAMQPPTVNVDMSGIAGTLSQVLSGLTAVSERIDSIERMQVVMDTGALVGELQQPLSKANYTAVNRRTRGGLV